MKPDSRIIFAADIPDRRRLLSVTREIRGEIDAVKLGGVVLYEHGWSIVSAVQEVAEVPVIVDLKLMDVPHVSSQIVRRAIQSGAAGVMVCGQVGRETLLRCREETAGKTLVVFSQFTGRCGLTSDRLADQVVEVALLVGCDALQVPADRPDRIEKVRVEAGEEVQLLCCGVGAQGTPIGDAVYHGADFEIIGRAIYAADQLKPKHAARAARLHIRSRLVARCA